MNATTDWLHIEKVTKRFAAPGGLFAAGGAAVTALEGVSLSLAPGQKVGVVGESGSGKTTLGRIVAGLLAPDAGRVTLEGVDVHAARGDERRRLARRVQTIFQDNSGALDPRLRVGSAVAEPLRVHAIGESETARRARVAIWFERVGLDRDLMARFPHELSGGQRQRVGIARALAPGPDLLIADEPVASLDVSIQTQILRLLADLVAESGVALLFVTHDLRVVRALTERVLVLRRGRAVELGPTEAVMRAPRHPYTRALAAAIPALHPAARHLVAATEESVEEAAAPTGTWREFAPGHFALAAD